MENRLWYPVLVWVGMCLSGCVCSLGDSKDASRPSGEVSQTQRPRITAEAVYGEMTILCDGDVLAASRARESIASLGIDRVRVWRVSASPAMMRDKHRELLFPVEVVFVPFNKIQTGSQENSYRGACGVRSRCHPVGRGMSASSVVLASSFAGWPGQLSGEVKSLMFLVGEGEGVFRTSIYIAGVVECVSSHVDMLLLDWETSRIIEETTRFGQMKRFIAVDFVVEDAVEKAKLVVEIEGILGSIEKNTGCCFEIVRQQERNRDVWGEPEE